MSRNPQFNQLVTKARGASLATMQSWGLLGELSDESKKLFDTMIAVYESKDTDYSADGKPMGNLRSSEHLGIPAYKGVLMRMGDKKQRIQSFIERKKYEVDNEKVNDTLLDLANYSILGNILRDETLESVIDISAASVSDVVDMFQNTQWRYVEIASLAVICCSLLNKNDENWVRIWEDNVIPRFDEIIKSAREDASTV